jgi:hypothetical protein
MSYCQNFKQKIKELEIKTQNIEALLLEYKKTAKEETAEKFEENLIEIEGFIEELKQEFKTKATQLIEEFIQRRENKNEKVEIIFDERDGRFIIEGDLNFSSRTHLDDFPNLIKEITGYFWPQKAQTINLPNLEKIRGSFEAAKAQTINLPNLKEVGEYFYADNTQTINLPNLEKIGRNFSAPNAQTINLPNLKEIGGFFYAKNAQTINLPDLKEVGGYFYNSKAKTINLPNLEKIEGNFYAPNAQTLNLPNLEKIGGDFSARNAQTINLPNIKEIGGDIYFNDNNLNLNALIEIAREWREKRILKGKIKIFDEEGNLVQEF